MFMWQSRTAGNLRFVPHCYTALANLVHVFSSHRGRHVPALTRTTALPVTSYIHPVNSVTSVAHPTDICGLLRFPQDIFQPSVSYTHVRQK
jgi:hypothetical protein